MHLFRDYAAMKVTALRLFLRVARVVPPPLAWWMGERLGWLVGALPLRDVRRCSEHLARAFPHADTQWVRRTTQGCFRHFGATALWTLVNWTRDATQLRRGIMVEGAEHLRDLVRAGRRGEGTVVFTGHLGNWELLARTFGGLTPSAVIGKRLRDPALDAVVQEQRSSGGALVVYQDADVRELMRILRSGRLIATLADQDIPQLAGCFVPWFGDLAWTPVAPAALALAARTPVQPFFLFRRAGRWVLHAGPRVCFVRGTDRTADQLAITAWVTSYEEALVRQLPEQWVWWHKRWRTRPGLAERASF